MTRLASILTSALLALTVSGVAWAQTAPNDDTTSTDTTSTDTTASPDTTTTTTTTTSPDTSTSTTTITDTTRTDTTTAPAPAPAPMPQDTDYVAADYDADDDMELMSGIGVAIAAGGGASGFTNEQLRDATNPGGDWDVRATIGTRSYIAFEGSYIGSAQSIDALGLDTDAVLVGNGVQGALRLNTTLNFPVQPFIFAGVGWRRYDLTNIDQNRSDVAGSDDVLEVPMGVGIAGKWNGLILDARGEFRATADEDLVAETNPEFVNDKAEMHRWGVKATVGVEF